MSASCSIVTGSVSQLDSFAKTRIFPGMSTTMGSISSLSIILRSLALLFIFQLESVNAGKAHRFTGGASEHNQPPNVIFILADDLGYADVGFNGRQYGSQIQTPYLDQLAETGVILSNYYVQPLCTPSRSQLLTGRYQIHTGLRSNLEITRPVCLALDEVTLAQKLKEVGYSTHMIGKWHLGHKKEECLPTQRGFDTFLGMYLGSGDYYTHVKTELKGKEDPPRFVSGYDFHRDTKQNRTVGYKYYGEYSTHVFGNRARNIIRTHSEKSNKPLFMYLSFQAPHGPLQVPNKYKLPFQHSNMNFERKILAAMIYSMDQAIGGVVEELKTTGMYENTVIIFSSDNGAPRDLPGSNWPFRGSKATMFEGGVRAAGLLHSPLLPHYIRGTESNAFMHITDWFPTIVQGMAGESLEGTKPLDGIDVWEPLRTGTKSARTELLHNIYLKSDETKPSQFDPDIPAGLRMGDWKLITGYKKELHRWKAPPESNISDIVRTERSDKNIWLFNMKNDPYEFHDMSERYPSVVNLMLNRIQDYMDNMTIKFQPPMDLHYDPADYGGVWGPWTSSNASFADVSTTVKKHKARAHKVKKVNVMMDDQGRTDRADVEYRPAPAQTKDVHKKNGTEFEAPISDGMLSKEKLKLKKQKQKEKEQAKKRKQKGKERERKKRQKKKEKAAKREKDALKVKRKEALKTFPKMISTLHALKVQEKLERFQLAKQTRNKKLKQQRNRLAKKRQREKAR